MPVVFRRAGALDSGEAQALVIRCSAARVQLHTAAFLHDALNLEKYCLIAIPGGVQAFSIPNHVPLAGWVLWKWFRFLMNLYKPPRIILIAHEDCAWYAALPAWLRKRSPAEMLKADLASAAARISKEFKAVRVEVYYMRVEGRDVVFESQTGS